MERSRTYLIQFHILTPQVLNIPLYHFIPGPLLFQGPYLLLHDSVASTPQSKCPFILGVLSPHSFWTESLFSFFTRLWLFSCTCTCPFYGLLFDLPLKVFLVRHRQFIGLYWSVLPFKFWCIFSGWGNRLAVSPSLCGDVKKQVGR